MREPIRAAVAARIFISFRTSGTEPINSILTATSALRLAPVGLWMLRLHDSRITSTATQRVTPRLVALRLYSFFLGVRIQCSIFTLAPDPPHAILDALRRRVQH